MLRKSFNRLVCVSFVFGITRSPLCMPAKEWRDPASSVTFLFLSLRRECSQTCMLLSHYMADLTAQGATKLSCVTLLMFISNVSPIRCPSYPRVVVASLLRASYRVPFRPIPLAMVLQFLLLPISPYFSSVLHVPPPVKYLRVSLFFRRESRCKCITFIFQADSQRRKLAASVRSFLP